MQPRRLAPTLFAGTLENGHVESLLVKLQHLGEVLPGPADSLLLEIVAKGPVTQHLKHGVVVGVVTHLLRSLCLPLTRRHFWESATVVLHRGVAQDDILELVHTGIGEHQGGVILDDHGCRWHNLVLL